MSFFKSKRTVSVTPPALRGPERQTPQLISYGFWIARQALDDAIGKDCAPKPTLEVRAVYVNNAQGLAYKGLANPKPLV